MLFSTDLSQLALVSPSAARFVAEHDLSAVACGRYELGEGDCVNVMEYRSKPRSQGVYEAHRDYADIQAVVSGQEYLEVAPTDGLRQTRAYREDDDCAFYSGDFRGERLLMGAGRFCLVLPQDAHMPGVSPSDTPEPVRKAVFKIRVENVRRA